jgi:hypothetical protein
LMTNPQETPAQGERIVGILKERSFHGDVFKLGIAVGSDMLKARVAREDGGTFEVGQQIILTWKIGAARLLPAGDAP